MSDNNISYGGQAVIGGVLIQSPKGWSLAVRNQKNEILNYFEERIPLIRRKGLWSLPLLRGIGALVDSLYVGYKGLSMSDSIYFEEEEDISLLSKIFNYVFIIGVLSLLIIGPRLLIDLINTNQINKGIYEGVLRGLIVIIYIFLIGKTKDAQELFEYHGAEHMTIASYEDIQSLDMEDIKKQADKALEHLQKIEDSLK